jgi:hypothetical protein
VDIFAYEGIMTGMYVWYSQFSTELWHYRMSSIKKYHFFRISFAFLSHFFRITISAEVRVMANLSYPVSSKKTTSLGIVFPSMQTITSTMYTLHQSLPSLDWLKSNLLSVACQFFGVAHQSFTQIFTSFPSWSFYHSPTWGCLQIRNPKI